MSEDLKLIFSCAPTLLNILTEPPALLNYLTDNYGRPKRKEENILLALTENENNSSHIDKKIKLTTTEDFIESDITSLDFEVHFKMRKTTVQKIIDLIEKTNIKPVQRGRPIMPLRKMVLLSIWLLTNQEGFRSVSVRFGIGKGHAHRAFEIFCVTLHSISHECIKWPNANEGKEIMQQFQQLSGLPNVIGAIGITHVNIPKPSNDESFRNRHGFYSVILQGICNHQYEFINVLAGPPGGTHEYDVWIQSPIYEKIKQLPNDILHDNSYLVTSGSYPVTDHTFPPYTEQDEWRPEHDTFNTSHQSALEKIKMTFKLFLSRFQRLTFLNMSRLDLIPKVILASCILHNLCISENEIEPQMEENNVTTIYDVMYVNNVDIEETRAKRDEIALNLTRNVNL